MVLVSIPNHPETGSGVPLTQKKIDIVSFNGSDFDKTRYKIRFRALKKKFISKKFNEKML